MGNKKEKEKTLDCKWKQIFGGKVFRHKSFFLFLLLLLRSLATHTIPVERANNKELQKFRENMLISSLIFSVIRTQVSCSVRASRVTIITMGVTACGGDATQDICVYGKTVDGTLNIDDSLMKGSDCPPLVFPYP